MYTKGPCCLDPHTGNVIKGYVIRLRDRVVDRVGEVTLLYGRSELVVTRDGMLREEDVQRQY